MNYKELTIATKEDIEAGIDDGFGGIYSPDGKRLLKYTDDSAEKYIIKEGTEIICAGAFISHGRRSRLKYLSLPDSLLAIGEYAFQYLTKLGRQNLPSKLEYIGDHVFNHCTSLRKITLPQSLSYIGTSAFSATRSNLKIKSNSPAYKVENDALLTTDGSRLLLVKTVADIFIIPPTVKTIDGNAFDTPNIRCLSIPSTVEEMGMQDFSKENHYNNLRVIAILNPKLKFEQCKWAMSINPGYGIIGIFVPEGSKDYFSKHIACASVIQEFRESERDYLLQPDYDFRKVILNEGTYSEDGKTLLKYRGTGLHYEIRPGTEVIAEEAFKNNFGLESIHIPDTVIKIEREAFCSCGNLEHVRLSPNLKKIGDKAFYGCQIKKIDIPKGLTTIGDEAFGGCPKLRYVKFPDTLVELQGFNECPKLEVVEVPSSVKVIKTGAFYESAIKNLILHEGLEEIECEAFAFCNIKEIQLPNSVKFIGNCAFWGEGLKHINIPPNAVLGKHNPFEGSKVKIDCLNPNYQWVNNVLYTANGKKILAYLSTKKEFHIPDTVEIIGEGAFANQTQLQKLYITKKVESEDNFAYLYGELYIPKELETEYKDVIVYQRHHTIIY